MFDILKSKQYVELGCKDFEVVGQVAHYVGLCSHRH